MDISRFGNFPLPLAKAMMDIASSHFAAPCKCMHASFIHTCEMRSFSFKSSRCHREKNYRSRIMFYTPAARYRLPHPSVDLRPPEVAK